MRKIRNINGSGKSKLGGYAGPVEGGRGGSRKSPDSFSGAAPPNNSFKGLSFIKKQIIAAFFAVSHFLTAVPGALMMTGCDTNQSSETKAPIINDITVAGAGVPVNGKYTVGYSAEIILGGNTEIAGNTYSWTYVTNPADAEKNLSLTPGPTAANITVSGFQKGVEYTFMLTVTNQSNLTSAKTVTIAVSANQAPTVTVENSAMEITLSAAPITLRGSSNDTDGTVSSVWTCEAYTPADGVKNPYSPNQVTALINNAGASTSGVNEATVALLKAGTYEFRLTATDNNGATAFERVSVVVSGYTAPPQSVTAAAVPFAVDTKLALQLDTDNYSFVGNAATGYTNSDLSGIIYTLSSVNPEKTAEQLAPHISNGYLAGGENGPYWDNSPIITQTFYYNGQEAGNRQFMSINCIGVFSYLREAILPYSTITAIPAIVLTLNKGLVTEL